MPETTTANPELLREQVQAILVQPLEAASVVLAAGPRIFDTDGNAVRIPKLVGSSEPGWIGEGELIPEHDVDFDEVKLMPNDRKSVKTLIRFSNELARQSVIGLDQTLRARLVRDVAAKLDDAFLLGDGTAGSVTGIVNQTGVQAGTLDLTDLDTLHDAMALAHAAEVTPNRWFLSGADYFAVRKLKTTDGKYLLQPAVTQDSPTTLLGVPATITNKLPQGTAVLANMGEVAVARDLNPTVKILDQRYAEYDEMALRVVARYDLGLLHPEGVVVLTAAAI